MGLVLSVSLALLVGASGDSISDDFEHLTLLTSETPAGAWDIADAFDQSSIGLWRLAARRGAQGVRIIDATSQPADGIEGRVFFGAADKTPTYSGRAWFRVSGLSADGYDSLIAVNTDWGGGRFSLVLVSFSMPGGRLFLDAWDDSGDLQRAMAIPTAVIDADAWHLVDVQLTGLGTANGCARVAEDGVQVAEICGRSWLNVAPPLANAGLVWQSPKVATGIVDLDDAVFGPNPVAASIAVEPFAASVSTGDCVALHASARSSWGQGAPFPFDEVVAVEGPFEVFSDAACTTAAAGLALVAGASEATAYVRPLQPGSHEVSLRPLSVLAPGLPVLSVSGAAIEPSAGPANLGVSCGCEAAPVSAWALLLAVLALRIPWRARGLRAARSHAARPRSRRSDPR